MATPAAGAAVAELTARRDGPRSRRAGVPDEVESPTPRRRLRASAGFAADGLAASGFDVVALSVVVVVSVGAVT